MNWSGGHVPNATTRKNLIWFWVIAALLTFHGCAWLGWQAAQDEPAPVEAQPVDD